MESQELWSLALMAGSRAKAMRREAGHTLDEVSKAARRHGLSWSESRVADFEAGRVAATLPTLIACCLALSDVLSQKVRLLDLLVVDAGSVEINDDLTLTADELNRVLGILATKGKAVERQSTERCGRADTPSGQPDDIALSSSRSSGEGSVPSDRNALAEGDAQTINEALSVVIDPVVRAALDALLGSFNPQDVHSVLQASGAAESRVSRALDIPDVALAALSASLWGRSFSDERDRRAGKSANAQRKGQVARQLRNELAHALQGD